MSYVTPQVMDFGTLIDVTQATALFGAEDGASKLVPNHHVPAPSAPAFP